MASFFQVHRYDDVEWVESRLLSTSRLATIRVLFAVWIAAGLKYSLFVFHQKGLLSRFVFYLTNLSCGSLVAYLISMAVLGFRDASQRLSKSRARGWAGWLLHQLYVVNWCIHPMVTMVFWSRVVRAHHVDTMLKLWKEISLHGLPFVVLVLDFLLSDRKFVSKRDWVMPNLTLLAYGGWIGLAGQLHPEGGRGGGPWSPYPDFAPATSPTVLFNYAAAIGAINLTFLVVYQAHQYKTHRLNKQRQKESQ